MADSNVRVPPDSTGKKIDASSLDVGADTVYRQRIVIADDSATAQYATVTGGALLVNVSAAVNISAMPTVTVTGGVAISGTAQVAISTPFTIQGISTTVQVAIATPFIVNSISAPLVVSHLSRTAAVTISTPFTVNNISATTIVAGVVGLTAGTAVIGDINAISRTVQVAIATPFTINNISATVNVVITSGGGTGFSFVDGTPHTAQEAAFVPVGGVFDDAAPGTLSEGDAGVARITTNRALHINLRDAAGSELGAASASGVFIRTATVTLAAGAANIGDINAVSRTVQVAIATPFTVNNISATVAVAGTVALGAGAANIGTINNVSATVTVAGSVNISATASVILAAGTANFGTLNDISRTVQVAVGTPFTVNNISASVVVTGLVGLTAGTAVIGDLNAISRTVQVAIGTPFTLNNISATVAVSVALGNYTPAVPSTSHGPVTVTVSTSAVVALVANPGTAMSVHITQLVITNAGTVSTLARIGTSATPSTVLIFVASAGGGAVINFDPPWKLSASATAIASVKPNSSGNVYFMVNFFVAA